MWCWWRLCHSEQLNCHNTTTQRMITASLNNQFFSSPVSKSTVRVQSHMSESTLNSQHKMKLLVLYDNNDSDSEGGMEEEK